MKTYLRECRWGMFMLLRGDMISQYVDMYGEWVETEVELFRTLLPDDGVCIEVGSNIGMHAVPLSRFCENGRIYCYEPQRPIFHILCGNMALNNRLNAVVRNLAVGENPGRVSIQTGDYEEAWNYGSFSIDAGFSTEGAFKGGVRSDTIDVVSLDDDPELADLARLDLIKIDAEGFEPQVLRGGRRLIGRHQPYLFVEANKAEVVEDILAELRSQGYSAYWFLALRFRTDNFNRSNFSVPGWDSNMVFCPPGRPSFDGKLMPVRDFDDLNQGVPIFSRFG
ncbi:hypothetical protein GCM10007874_48250 [Labrys miyagiensis]|uniref:Methyltransferase FkbM domain-containing protein n=1 Tax=Labrys miyagiensis TaxID=346912 RepID=A0ABQ6CNA8_9HYPH|nr:FkbM family methyltransferase [Labrys miyagiensis]GLS21808.1 hypothetical protein GCM10007874_48250 [Labrys miyagiensis]